MLELLGKLRDAGHFSYQGTECRFMYPLNGGTSDLHRDLSTREAELAQWDADLDRLRRQYIPLNNITLRRLWSMVRAVSGAPSLS